MLKVDLKQLLAEANADLVGHSAEAVMKMKDDAGVVLVDVRETQEWEAGHIAGAVHAPRGLLEMVIEPTHARHNPIFAEDRDFVLY